MDPEAFPKPRPAEVLAYVKDHPGKTQKEVATDLGFRSATSIRRVVEGSASPDGKVGRPPLLSHASEMRVLSQIQDLTAAGTPVSQVQVQAFVAAAYAAERGEPLQHEVDRHYIFRVAKRHGVHLRSRPVHGVEARRDSAQTRRIVGSALQGNKSSFMRIFPHGLARDMVIMEDETSVGRTHNWTGGRPHLGVGEVHPREVIDDDAKVTAAIYFDGEGNLISLTFLKEGAPLVNRPLFEKLLRNPAVSVVWNDSGVMQGDKEGTGAWTASAAEFTKRFDEMHGKHPAGAPFRAALFIDGCKPHLDEEALKLFTASGIAVIKIHPNLTQIIQVPDNSRVFGKLLERLRLCAGHLDALFGEQVPEDVYLKNVANIITGTLTLDAVTEAMISCGFSFDEDGVVTITDFSITRALDKFEVEGRFRPELLAADGDGMALRNRAVLQMQHFVAEGIRSGALPHGTTEWVDPRVVEATARAAEMVPTRHRPIGGGIQEALKRGQRRMRVPDAAVQPGTRKGTVVLNDVTNIFAATSSSSSSSSAPPATGAPRRKRAHSTLEDILDAAPDKKRALSEALPGVDLGLAHGAVMKFIKGSRDLQWTVARVREVVQASKREARKAAAAASAAPS